MNKKDKPTIQLDQSPAITPWRKFKQVEFSQGTLGEEQGSVIVESRVSITVNGEQWISLLCTPIHLEALAIGFLYNEGIINDTSAVVSLRVCPQGDNVDVWLTHSVEKPQLWTRTSGCSGGVTGVTPAKHESLSFTNGGMLTPGQINYVLAQFYQVQTLYRQTGGVHTSALSDGHKIIMVAEDIGRHNTLDKLAGRCLMEKEFLSRRILLTTGRISSEMLQKAARLKAPIVISRTSPSSRSIDMAEAFGITLIGYARRDHFIVYTHPERIFNESEI
jgi:FdhD protein